MSEDGLTLAEALSSLRAELAEAIEKAGDESLRFKVNAIDVELQVVATTTRGATGEVGLWQVVKLGGKLDRGHSATHTVKLSLTPDVGGGDVHVNDTVARRPA